MSYELHFHPLALKEWKKLAKNLQEQFKKVLKQRLENPHLISASLRGNLKGLLQNQAASIGISLSLSCQQ